MLKFIILPKRGAYNVPSIPQVTKSELKSRLIRIPPYRSFGLQHRRSQAGCRGESAPPWLEYHTILLTLWLNIKGVFKGRGHAPQ